MGGEVKVGRGEGVMRGGGERWGGGGCLLLSSQ